MKSRSKSPQARSTSTSTATPSPDVAQPLGNAAAAALMPEGMDEGMGMLGGLESGLNAASGAAEEAGSAVDSARDAASQPLSAGAAMLGLDGLRADGDSLSYSSSAAVSTQTDVTLGMIGPLSLGLNGMFAADLGYSLTGSVAGGWFGGRYATLAGRAQLKLNTTIGAFLAIKLGIAEAGLRGGLDMLGNLEGTLQGSVELDEQGRPIAMPSVTVHVEGAVDLAAAAELYLETLLTDEQTWELGQLPLGIVTGFGLDLTFGEGGVTDFSGSLGGGFEQSPELQAVIADMQAKMGA